MDLSCHKSDLSLGLRAHRAAANGADLTNREPPRSVALQLFDPHSGSHDEDPDDTPDAALKDTEFRILGYPMSLKRRRFDPSPPSPSSSSPTSSSSSAAPSSDIESHRAAVRSWGCQPLPLTDPDLFAIMEKERQCHVRGIETSSCPRGQATPHSATLVLLRSLHYESSCCFDRVPVVRNLSDQIKHQGVLRRNFCSSSVTLWRCLGSRTGSCLS